MQQSTPHVPFALKLRHWIDEDPKARNELLRSHHLSERVVETLTDPKRCDATIVGKYHQDVEKASGIAVKDVLLRDAKALVWGTEDRAPHIATYEDLVQALKDEVRRAGGIQPLTKKWGLCRPETLRRWMLGRRLMEVEKMGKVLGFMTATSTTPVTAITAVVKPPASSQAPERSHDVSKYVDRSIQRSLDAMRMSAMTFEQLASWPGALVDGQRHEVFSIIVRLVRAAELTPEVMTVFKNGQPLAEKEVKVLEEVFGRAGSQKR